MAGLRNLTSSRGNFSVCFASPGPRILPYGCGPDQTPQCCAISSSDSDSATHVLSASSSFKHRNLLYVGEDPRRWRWRSSFSAKAEAWKDEQSPYNTLGIQQGANDEDIKAAYRLLAKQFHPDVYNDSVGGLEEGETPATRFIRIQAAYELLMDRGQRRQYDLDHLSNPMQASKSWIAWVLKKKKAFDQRGEMAASVWAEQQQREMNLKARRLSRLKNDPKEERRLLALERQALVENQETILKRHTLVLKKRDLLRRKSTEEDKKKLIQQLLAEEGLELDDDRF